MVDSLSHKTQMNLKKLLIFFLALVASHYLLVIPSYAVNMNSDQYRIQFGTVNSGGKAMTNTDYKLNTSVGQTAAKEFQASGYIIKAGFQYIYSRIPFTFSLSSIQVDLGSLLPSVPSTGSITLSVSFGAAGQYIVTARADRPLATASLADTIPFTGCDGGVDTCTTTLAKPWTLSTAYGFGYDMTGEDIPADFINNTYFRPFPNLLLSEAPAVIMQSTNVTADITPTPFPAYTPAPLLTGAPHDTTHQATITMKGNVSNFQAAGTYATVIRFLATPSF